MAKASETPREDTSEDCSEDRDISFELDLVVLSGDLQKSSRRIAFSSVFCLCCFFATRAFADKPFPGLGVRRHAAPSELADSRAPDML